MAQMAFFNFSILPRLFYYFSTGGEFWAYIYGYTALVDIILTYVHT